MTNSWAWVNQEDTLLSYIFSMQLCRHKHERLTSCQFPQHWRLAGQVNHYYILFHHTPCSALPKRCSCVLLLGQSRQGDPHAGTCWCCWSNLLHRSPSRESFELLLWNVEVQQSIKVSIQPQTAEHDMIIRLTSGIERDWSSPISTLCITAALNDRIPTNTAICKKKSMEVRTAQKQQSIGVIC